MISIQSFSLLHCKRTEPGEERIVTFFLSFTIIKYIPPLKIFLLHKHGWQFDSFNLVSVKKLIFKR